MLDDGLYGLTYMSQDGREAEYGAGLAVLRDGLVLGSDRWGGVFRGRCTHVPDQHVSIVSVTLNVPPHGVLLTGLEAGPEGATLDFSCRFAKPAPTSSATFSVHGEPLKIELRYIGPLPI